MSWLLNLGGGAPKAPTATRAPAPTPAQANAGAEDEDIVPRGPEGDFPNTDDEPKVPDLVFEGRMVTTKQANRPFLSYREYKDKLDAEHEAWAQRKALRDAAIARGEKVGPAERDPTEEQEIGCAGLLKIFVVVLLAAALAGKFFTGSYSWNYETNLKKYWPTNQTLFSERMLANYDGTDAEKPIYLAIDGDVFDVSTNRKTYGPGGSYHNFAGVDAARAYATGCFADHRTHDLRGLSEKELGSVEHWKKFFANHKTYYKIGRVQHEPIDPASPIPPSCMPAKGGQQPSPQKPEPKEKEKVVGPEHKRTEL